MEAVKLPLPSQLDAISSFLSGPGATNTVHLFTGTPITGPGANISDMQANEVSSGISWYAEKSNTWQSEPQTDPLVANQLDVVGSALSWNYSSGDGSDASVTVTGYFLQQSSNVLVGYAMLPAPVVVAGPYNSVDIQPYVPFPSQT